MAKETNKSVLSIKGKYMVKPLVRYFYAPLAKPLLKLIDFMNLPVRLVNFFSIALFLIASYIIVAYPAYIWLAGIVVLLALLTHIADEAWARYNKKSGQYQWWFEETSWIVGVCLLFTAGAISAFNATDNVNILILWGVALFSVMMMNYAGSLISLAKYQYEAKEDLIGTIKKSFWEKRSWLAGTPLGFSFDYQWTVLFILVLFNQFTILFWIFIVLGNLKWLQGFVTLRASR